VLLPPAPGHQLGDAGPPPGVSGRFDDTGPATAEKGSRARALGAIGGLVLVVVVFVLKSELRTWLDQLFN
jgi:hypothetical protein